MKTTLTHFTFIFWLLVALDITALMFGWAWIHTIVKPLLMPALMLMIVQAGRQVRYRVLILTALFFSWLGDMLLMFDLYHPGFFMAGLAAFLVTHLLYIFYFARIKSDNTSMLIHHPWLIALVVLYCSVLFILLLPGLGKLQMPVLVYATVIGCMLLASLHAYRKIKSPANRYLVMGALLFVLSDSILAINKFYTLVPLGGAMVMFSYCTAQYYIASGVIQITTENKL